MPIVQKRERNAYNQLGDLLKILYEDVLLPCESDKKLIKNKTSNNSWKSFMKESGLEFIYNDKTVKGKFKALKNSIVIDNKYAKTDISNSIIFVSKNNQTFSSLFVHIRNAFAHNQIFVDNGFVIMYDKPNQKSTVFTMIAHIEISVLKELIKTIRNIK